MTNKGTTMKRIVLSTSTSCIGHLSARHGIYLVPLHIMVNGKHFLDSKEIDTARLSQMLYDNPHLDVHSTAPTCQEIERIFDELYQSEYQEVLICTAASVLSQAHENFSKVIPKYVGKMNIYLYDTKTININEGALAFEANLMMQEGKSMLDIIKYLNTLRANNTFIMSLSDLRILIQRKRLSAPAGFFANLLNIKPILWIDDDGYVVVKEKVRKFERVMHHMTDIIIEQIANRNAFIYMVDTSIGLHTHEFKRLLANEYGLYNIPVIPISTVALANHGPTGVGLGVYYGNIPRVFQYLS